MTATLETTAHRLRVAMVLTRDARGSVGRAKTIRQIKDVLSSEFEVEIYLFPSVLEIAGIADIAKVVWIFARNLLKRTALPLQCAIYAVTGRREEVASQIVAQNYDIIYLDTIRLYLLFRLLHKTCPAARFVFDFDDLMSLRAKTLAEKRRTFGLGYLSDRMPLAFRKALMIGRFGSLLTRYEAFALTRVEKQAAKMSNGVVLVSEKEREDFVRTTNAEFTAVHAILPPTEIISTPAKTAIPVRFVFVGSDLYIQNREAIAFLIEKWKSISPPTPLHIYGRQSSDWGDIEGLFWHGFVEDLAEAYDDSSLVLAPSFVMGGIKTKVLEAWGYGRPVLGTPLSFEGMGLESYALSLSSEAWDPFLLNPLLFADLWHTAQLQGSAFVRVHDRTDYRRKWIDAINFAMNVQQ